MVFVMIFIFNYTLSSGLINARALKCCYRFFFVATHELLLLDFIARGFSGRLDKMVWYSESRKKNKCTEFMKTIYIVRLGLYIELVSVASYFEIEFNSP